MNTLLISNDVIIRPVNLEAFGQAANEAAESAVFKLYQDRRPINTQRSQRTALAIFAEFMRSCGLSSPDLYSDPLSWMGITWGLVLH